VKATLVFLEIPFFTEMRDKKKKKLTKNFEKRKKRTNKKQEYI
jgi:hypothetical protein